MKSIISNKPEKYSSEWKQAKKAWAQKHDNGQWYVHHIQHGTEYSKPCPGYLAARRSAREIRERGGI